MTPSNAARDQRRAEARKGLCCASCGIPIIAQRSTLKTCSERCRRLSRHRHRWHSHQRRIQDRHRRSYPRPVIRSLESYSVDFIDRAAAEGLVKRYEYLGNIGTATLFVGLLSPQGELHGVACFGRGPSSGNRLTGTIRDRIGDHKALCLERACTVHYAPPNAASFLNSRACRLVYEQTGTAIFFAYADPAAGEYGAVYQAANWEYLGQGLNGGSNQRRWRMVYLQPGRRDRPENWQIDYALRHPTAQGGKRLTDAEALALGWKKKRVPAKHVYCIHVGPDRRRWRSALATLPYPKPQPERQRRYCHPAISTPKFKLRKIFETARSYLSAKISIPEISMH